jgi:hypothetical protein
MNQTLPRQWGGERHVALCADLAEIQQVLWW